MQFSGRVHSNLIGSYRTLVSYLLAAMKYRFTKPSRSCGLNGRERVCEALRCHRFHIGGINFHRNGLRHHVHRKDQAIQIFLANQNPFDALEGASSDANPLATLQEGMWFYAEGPFNCPSNCLNLSFRDDRDAFAAEQDHVNSWGRHDLQPAIEPSP